MITSNEDIHSILKYVRNGSKITFSQNHYGQNKVKIKYGPFNLLTRKFWLDSNAYETLREKIHRH